MPEGHVISFCQDWGIAISSGTNLHPTTTTFKQIEAHVIMPLQHPSAAPSAAPSVTVQGDGNAVNVGDHNNATVNLSYNYVLEQLKDEVERSSLPEAEKKSALATLAELMAVEGLKAILGLGFKLVAGG